MRPHNAPLSWEEASRAFAEAVVAYHAERGRSQDDPGVVSTVRTNTELVPTRAENLLGLLRDVRRGDGLSGARVIDAGSGFGAFAAYLAIAGGVERVVALDSRADLTASAMQSVSGLGLEQRLTYVHGDMRDLSEIVADFDVVIVNNAFIYLPTRHDMQLALGAFHRALRSGGTLAMYHANRWTLREPFTHDPLVHLLHPVLGRAVARATGWRHNHGRVRLVSPLELKWLAHRAGFDTIRYGSFGSQGFEEGRLFRTYYALVARKPDGKM